MIIPKRFSEIVQSKVEQEIYSSLKAKKESSDRVVQLPRVRQRNAIGEALDDKNGISGLFLRKCFRCGDPNHLIGECPKPPRDKNQRAFVGGSWSDSGEEDDEKVNNEACLVAQTPNEVCSESSYFSDENSSIDDLALDNEYDKLCKMSLKIITKNKRLKNTRNSLEKEIRELKDKLSTLEKNKGVDLECTICQSLKIENEKLKEESTRLNKFEKSTHCLNEMLSSQKPSGDKLGLGFNSFEASSSGTKKIKFVKAQKKMSSDGEPKNVNEALGDESWIVAMQEKLNQFIANDVWELVPQPKNMTIIGTKWVFRNKLDENGVVSRNKARLVAQGYNQQEGIDYDETYASVARLESIRILLAYACALDFNLFKMDVKSAFLNGFINKEKYVAQPPGFINFEKPDNVYKLKKALYGLKQAPKAWYDRLKAFLIKHEYKMGMVNNTLFTKKKSSNLIIVQIYVDDIIFGSTCQEMCDEFAKIMHDEFEMSMMGEINFFLGLQIKQMEDDIFFNQSKYIKEMLKKFGLEDSKPMKTPMSSDTKLTKDEECESVDSTKYQGMIGSLLYLTTSRPDIMFSVCLCARFQEAPKTSHLEAVKRIFRYIKGTTYLGLWYPKGTGIETVVYADSDHAGDYVDRKSTSEFAQILDIPCEGACVFTEKWSLNELAYGVPTDCPYQTNPPSPDDIILSIRIDTEGQLRRIRYEEEIDVLEYQVLTRKIEPTLKPLEEIIRENVFCLRGNRDHVPACLCYMLYCVVHSEKFNLAYFMAK
ncbi:retrovirus-related pol polyprotein from transposon TNT 1-94 [Tanacetum coccineum]